MRQYEGTIATSFLDQDVIPLLTSKNDRGQKCACGRGAQVERFSKELSGRRFRLQERAAARTRHFKLVQLSLGCVIKGLNDERWSVVL